MAHDTDDVSTPSARFTLSRRDLLRLAGAGLAVSALPELAGCTPDESADDEKLAASATWVELRRRDDLVVLRLGLIGLEVRDADSATPPAGLTLQGRLYLARTGESDAYVLVDFPPQHILEQAWLEPTATDTEKPTAKQLAQHMAAGASRLSFFIPPAVEAIPWEVEPLLTALTTLELHVAHNAWDEPSVRMAPPVFTLAKAQSLPGDPGGTQLGTALRAVRGRSRSSTWALQSPGASSSATPTGDARDSMPVPKPPTSLDTAIELPARLVISPNRHATWQHAAAPVMSSQGRVELWHSRMSAAEGWMRTIRALDCLDARFDANGDSRPLKEPFLASLSSSDRAGLVHLTSNYQMAGDDGTPVTRAVPVERLMLSALGGWLEAHGTWSTRSAWPNIGAWQHSAVMGRDQKVVVTYHGALYPFGHAAVLVKVTERKFLPGYEDTAWLWQRFFVVVKEPVKTYEGGDTALGRALPFTSVRFKTLVTPTLDAPTGPLVAGMPDSRWINVGGDAFRFEVEAFDHDGNAHTFDTACMFLDSKDILSAFPPKGTADQVVADLWAHAASGRRRFSSLRGQRVAFAPSQTLDDTRYTVRELALTARATPGAKTAFAPTLVEAELVLDAAAALSGTQVASSFKYLQHYLDNGFDVVGQAVKNATGAFMELATGASAAVLDLGSRSDRSGGFVNPDMAITALSRTQGLLAGDPSKFLGAGASFDPANFFSMLTGKLFGVVSLADLVKAVGGAALLEQAPRFITQALDAAQTVFGTFQKAAKAVGELKTLLQGDFKAALQALIANAGDAALSAAQKVLYARAREVMGAVGVTALQLMQQLESLSTDVDAVKAGIDGLVADIEAVAKANEDTDVEGLANTIVGHVKQARDALASIGVTLKTLALPIDAGLKAQVADLYSAVVSKLLPDQAAMDDFALAAKAFAKAEEAVKSQHVRVEWNPTIGGWPAGNEIFHPNDVKGLRLSIDLRGKSKPNLPAGASVRASLSDFELRLLGDDPFIALLFDRLVFSAGTSGKAEVDVVFRDVRFGGPLSFIETIRRFIPLDGFSDPPAIDVDATGLRASYSLPLPNVSVGIFSLENLAVSAGLDIPFVGKSLTVSFAFCSREAPFSLTVAMLGGGGFVGLTLGPDGVRLLEISLEAQAALAVDFGVASGSISVALGIYFAIEESDVRLTGYLRMRGCVDVLGLISASIELRLELGWEKDTQKVTGRASLEIEVSVLCFSTTVSFEVEKKFSGGNADPTLRQVLGYSGNDAPWEDYCGAFAPVTP